ncbi:MAG TPA: hypothetical protein VGM51_04940 [Armatimonadota bacterium]
MPTREIRRDGGRVFIEGAPRVTWDTGQMCEFASCLVSALDCLGQTVPYHDVMAACGAAFRFTLSPDHWNPGNYSVDSITTDPRAPTDRAFRMVGRPYTWVQCGDAKRDAASITESIDRGVPVIASGVVGPADYSLITGYDCGGEVLMGWSTYQDIPVDHNEPADESGYFRKSQWHANTRGFILIGEAVAPPPRREMILDTLRWAVELVRYPRADDWVRGLEGYDALVDDLLDDSLYPPGDMETLGFRYLCLLCDMMMVDDRRAAIPFLHQVASDEPDMAGEALAAASCYESTAAARDEARSVLPEDFSEATTRSVADRTTRLAYADAIRRIRDADLRAIEHIERCCGVP